MAKNKADVPVRDNQKIIRELTTSINKRYDSPVIVDPNMAIVVKRSTGIFPLDFDLEGGFPRGRGIILVGEKSTFKSSLLYMMGASNQRICGTCLNGDISEVNFRKVKIIIDGKNNDNVRVEKVEDGFSYYSKKYIADATKKNLYCPGEFMFTRSSVDSAGKSSYNYYEYDLSCSHCISPQYSVFVLSDGEHNYTKGWARKFNVVNHFVFLVMPEYTEQVGDIMRETWRTGSVSFIGVDSLDALGPKVEDESSFEDRQMGVQAIAWNKITRFIHSFLNKPFLYTYITLGGKKIEVKKRPEPTIGIISQYREKIGAMGDPRVSGGGRGKDFLSSLTIELSRGKKEYIIENEKKVGVRGLQFLYDLTKSKVSTPHRRGSFYFDLEKLTINNIASIIEYGVRFDVITKKGAWLSYGKDTFQGEKKFTSFLEEHPEIVSKIKSEIYRKGKK